MKTIILFTLLLLAASCQKEQTKRMPIQNLPTLNPCIELDRTKFIGNWTYVSMQNRNDQFPQIIGDGIFQDITIDKDSTRFTRIPALSFKWTYLDCSIVRGVNLDEDLLVSFWDDNTMTFEGKTSGTIWTLKR